MRTSGFTLIELLIVIAIVGILSSIVLASFNAARDKGIDSRIKSQLHEAISQASNVSDSTGSYVDVCVDPKVIELKDDAAALAMTGTGECNSDANNWAVQAPLKSGGYWCVDSNGKLTAETDPLGSSTSCN